MSVMSPDFQGLLAGAFMGVLAVVLAVVIQIAVLAASIPPLIRAAIRWLNVHAEAMEFNIQLGRELNAQKSSGIGRQPEPAPNRGYPS